ncbi:Protein argonaute [Tumidithrix helvetica PCC 7403]|uniref:Piwi domain-containing protein n=1 Tax=Tumidithrix helvetica TaxID=3457545 RepID=UPI003C96831C
MNTTTDNAPKPPISLCEIALLSHSELNLMRFRLSPHIDEREIGNPLSFHLCRKFAEIMVVWDQGDFYAIAKPQQNIPTVAEWREALENIQNDIKEFGEQSFSVQVVKSVEIKPETVAQLAYQILKISRPFSHAPFNNQVVQVVRKPEFSAETVEINDLAQPALSLSVRSDILFRGNLAEFYQNHPQRQNAEKLLTGLKVQDIDSGGSGQIERIAGTIQAYRDKLIKLAAGSTSKQALIDAPDDQPIVAVKFGKNKKLYEYALAALRPCITEDTADRFEVNYGQLLKSTKIPYSERMELLKGYKLSATEKLKEYGLQLSQKSLNSSDNLNSFWQPSTPVNQTPLLFGKDFRGLQSGILTGLKKGGVYRHHPDLQAEKINIVALKLCEQKVGDFLGAAMKRLKDYGFDNQVVETKSLEISKLDGADARVILEKEIDRIAGFGIPIHIVLVFLPEGDRQADKEDGGSLYQAAYSHLLRRKIASQVIYSDTLEKNHSHILNQVIPGILAKMGNLPFILAEPLDIADYFIGLDISRASKKQLAGTMNACASVRLYNKQGEFIRYKIEDSLIEGEEIPQRLLENLLPASELENKTVLIYRDGRFCGQEVSHLLKRAKAIGANFILVESRKSGAPRLYGFSNKSLIAPKVGVALKLSSHEAILVTTDVPASIGVPRPIRLTVRKEGYPATIDSVLDTTLKLTLLHHGALKPPRVPMPIYGADRMAYLKLNGIYPSVLEGDRQFWL